MLVAIEGPETGKRFTLTEPVVTVGRDGTNIVRLHDTEVSRRHAEFRRTDEGYQVVDLGSSNGTFVNNRAVKERPLQSGDHVQFGQSVLVFTAAAAAGAGSEISKKITLVQPGERSAPPPSIVKSIAEEAGGQLLSEPSQASGVWLKNALANLGVMYQAAQATSHILDTDQLLERIMDLIFQSIPAERGCVVLRNAESGELEPRAVRWRPGLERQDKIELSRSIVDYVLKERQGLLVTDATQDQRFGAAPSIVRFGIREAICVPMKGRHETLGVVYLDTRTTPLEQVKRTGPTSRLSEDHLYLAIAIAHQAALALEETRYYRAMVQAERLAAMGQTIAAISHHVKNILQGLRSGTDLLGMGIKDSNQGFVEQGWKIVEKNQGRIYELVMDMLSYSKEREPAVEPTKVNDIVDEVAELIAGRTREKGIVLEKHLFAELPVILVDPEGLHRSLLNLAQNGLDALEGRPNAKLTLTTELGDEGRLVLILVSDNGPGIAADKLPDLFKPFMSTKGTKGTGLGLAVSRKIIREHGGDITVETAPEAGCAFVVSLPVQSPLSVDVTGAMPKMELEGSE
jgi:signal transduction histidine kinase